MRSNHSADDASNERIHTERPSNADDVMAPPDGTPEGTDVMAPKGQRQEASDVMADPPVGGVDGTDVMAEPRSGRSNVR